jgi:hypothetical protein
MTALGIRKMAILSLLTWTGGHLSPLLLHKLDAVLDYLEVGRWMRDHHLTATATPIGTNSGGI